MRELGLLNDAYFEIGVTLAERHLLIELTSSPCSTMGEIAERLLLDKSTASRLIARAIKKGYVKYTSDSKDKRKKWIHLTELGKKTLEAFEPIAFQQTKQALLALSKEEIEQVCEGVALYAKGLKNSRLSKTGVIQKIPSPIDSSIWGVKPISPGDEEGLYKIFKEVIDSGDQFPYDSNSIQEFHRRFLEPQSQVYVTHSSEGEVTGGFAIKPNFCGRADHIANGAYMVKKTHQGQGIGTLLVKASLEIAKKLGFRAIQFNMVLSQNLIAVRLYQKLGFSIIGTIPEAIRNSDGSFQDGYIFYQKL